MAVVLDLEELPVTDRVELLRERMLAAPVPLSLELHDGVDLLVRSRVADLGCVHLLSTRSQGGDTVRTERLARDGTRPSLMVSLVDRGTVTVVRDDEATILRPGDIGLYLTTEAYRLRATPGALRHTYQIPLDALGVPLRRVRDQLRNVIRPDGSTTAVVSAFLGATARNAPAASRAEQSRLEHPTLELVRLLLTRPVADGAVGRAATAASLATRIEEHVRAQLDDPGLSARSVAAAFSISERYVYTILGRRGIDLGDLVRERRLERAARLLEDPRCARWTISAVARRCGFADHAHFSRAFRARFGVTPTEWRRRGTAVFTVDARS